MADAAVADSARGAQTTISSSGGNGTIQRGFQPAAGRVPGPRRARTTEPGRKFSTAHQRQQPLRRPQRDGGCARPGAFQADLAQVQIFRREIGVGRIVFVECADAGIAEQDAAAAVGLKTVLVRIDHDGIGLRDARSKAARVAGVRLSARVK